MEKELIEVAKENLVNKSTDELFDIWIKNDHNEYSGESFEAIKQILLSRGIELSKQKVDLLKQKIEDETKSMSIKNNCSFCSKEIDNNAIKCPHCGEWVPEIKKKRNTVFVIGLIGAIGAFFQGFNWLSVMNSAVGAWAELSNHMGEWLDSSFMIVKIAACTLIICGICGLLFSIKVLLAKGNKSVNAVMLVVAGILPILVAIKAFFGLPMILAGILAFNVEPNKPASTDSDT